MKIQSTTKEEHCGKALMTSKKRLVITMISLLKNSKRADNENVTNYRMIFYNYLNDLIIFL